ncbi:MAG TPA: hypothetical protein VEI94_10610 [Candidatus Bathyarchaeia archaeon]|nr:hypothetical protein [Candidatus Bathyarchaeia archaeon]
MRLALDRTPRRLRKERAVFAFALCLAALTLARPALANDEWRDTLEPAPTPSATPQAAQNAASVVLSPANRKALEDARFVYIQSTRKDGSLSRPAEIWFAFFDDAVWVASAPTSWRVKRIKWKRPQARIAIGSQDGPSIRARGELVRDEKLYDRLCGIYAVKYAERWSRWESSFRDGLRSGERVLIRYTPVGQ